MILHVNFPILEMVFSSYFLLFFSTIPGKKLVNKPSISTIQILLSNFTKYFQVISCKVHLILYSDTIGPMRPKLDSSLCLIFFTYLPESQIQKKISILNNQTNSFTCSNPVLLVTCFEQVGQCEDCVREWFFGGPHPNLYLICPNSIEDAHH